MVALKQVEAEFSRIVDVEGLGEDELERRIEADERERKALARRFGLVSLEGLKATVRVQRLSGGAVRVRGDLEADVVQSCVVTLEPVAAHIAESFSVTFASEPEADLGAEVDLSPEGEDLPEPLAGGALDIGEAVAQHLALSLDPYPRAPGVTFEAAKYPSLAAQSAEKGKESGPFAALASLRKREQN